MRLEEIGIIQDKNKPEGKDVTFLEINNKSFSVFDEKLAEEYNKGDCVKVEYEQKGKYNNVKAISKAQPRPNDAGNRYEKASILACTKASAIALQQTQPTPKQLAEYSKDLHKELFGEE